jgi:hypothetical protein
MICPNHIEIMNDQDHIGTTHSMHGSIVCLFFHILEWLQCPWLTIEIQVWCTTHWIVTKRPTITTTALEYWGLMFDTYESCTNGDRYQF